MYATGPKNNDSIKNYCDAVALTDNFVFVKVVSRRELLSKNIDFDNLFWDPKDNAYRVDGPEMSKTEVQICSTNCII